MMCALKLTLRAAVRYTPRRALFSLALLTSPSRLSDTETAFSWVVAVVLRRLTRPASDAWVRETGKVPRAMVTK